MFAARSIRAGEDVFAAPLRDLATTDGALDGLIGEKAEHRHLAASLLSRVIKDSSELEGSPATQRKRSAYMNPEKLKKNDEVAEFAHLLKIASQRALWSPRYTFPHNLDYLRWINSSLDTSDLFGVFHTEAEYIKGKIEVAEKFLNAFSSFDAVQRAQGNAPVWEHLPSLEDLAWAAKVLRVKGSASPYGEMVGAFSLAVRQDHTGCRLLQLQEAHDAGSDVTYIVGTATADVPEGAEMCLGYSDTTLSRQQLLARFGLHEESALVGLHYAVPNEGCPYLEEKKCAPGEMLLSSSNDLTEHALFCYMLSQLPVNVRHDYKELLYKKNVKHEALQHIASALSELLRTQYAVNMTDKEVQLLRELPPAQLEMEEERSASFPEDLAELESLQGDEGFPDALKELIREQKEMLEKQKQKQAPVETEKTEEVEKVYEGPERKPAPVEVSKMNDKMSSSAKALRTLYAKVATKWQLTQHGLKEKEERRRHAETERVREQTRLQLEELELSRLAAQDAEEDAGMQ